MSKCTAIHRFARKQLLEICVFTMSCDLLWTLHLNDHTLSLMSQVPEDWSRFCYLGGPFIFIWNIVIEKKTYQDFSLGIYVRVAPRLSCHWLKYSIDHILYKLAHSKLRFTFNEGASLLGAGVRVSEAKVKWKVTFLWIRWNRTALSSGLQGSTLPFYI